MKYDLWDNKLSIKISIGTSPFHLVYGKEANLPIQLGLPILKLIQHETEEPDSMVRKVYELIELQ